MFKPMEVWPFTPRENKLAYMYLREERKFKRESAFLKDVFTPAEASFKEIYVDVN